VTYIHSLLGNNNIRSTYVIVTQIKMQYQKFHKNLDTQFIIAYPILLVSFILLCSEKNWKTLHFTLPIVTDFLLLFDTQKQGDYSYCYPDKWRILVSSKVGTQFLKTQFWLLFDTQSYIAYRVYHVKNWKIYPNWHANLGKFTQQICSMKFSN